MDKDNLKNFIKINHDLIDNFQVKRVYNKLLKSPVEDTIFAFSYICSGWVKQGLNPLEKLDDVPTLYSRYITASKITVPSNINVIKYAAFNDAKLDTLIINKNVKRIENNAFFNCEINSVTIKSSNIEIDDHAFLKANIKQLIIPYNVHLPYFNPKVTNIEKIIKSK